MKVLTLHGKKDLRAGRSPLEEKQSISSSAISKTSSTSLSLNARSVRAKGRFNIARPIGSTAAKVTWVSGRQISKGTVRDATRINCTTDAVSILARATPREGRRFARRPPWGFVGQLLGCPTTL
jgi:hypothetical protein